MNLEEDGLHFQWVENLWKKDSIQNSLGKFIFSVIQRDPDDYYYFTRRIKDLDWKLY